MDRFLPFYIQPMHALKIANSLKDWYHEKFHKIRKNILKDQQKIEKSMKVK